MAVDLNMVNRLWDRRWPQCRPEAHTFRFAVPDRWVRFHSLPRSKRYPDSLSDYQTLLERHNTVLTELRAKDVYVFTVAYKPNDLFSGKEPIHTGLHPRAVHWRRVADESEPEYYHDVYVSRHRYVSGNLDTLLRAVADDRASGVFFAGQHLEWLYHPYDGGADIILPTTTERNTLKANHRDWLSKHPHGL